MPDPSQAKRRVPWPAVVGLILGAYVGLYFGALETPTNSKDCVIRVAPSMRVVRLYSPLAWLEEKVTRRDVALAIKAHRKGKTPGIRFVYSARL